MKSVIKFEGQEEVIVFPKYIQKKIFRLKKMFLKGEDESEKYMDIEMEVLDYLENKSCKAFEEIEDIDSSIDCLYLDLDLDNITDDTIVTKFEMMRSQFIKVDLSDSSETNPIYDESLPLSERLEESIKGIKNKPLKLYWVADGDEDWFVISHEDCLAHDFHNDYEGLDAMPQSQHFSLLYKKELEEDGEVHEEEDRDIEDYIDYIDVTEVLELPTDFLTSKDTLLDYSTVARHAQIEDLEKLGFEIVDNGDISGQRMVKYNNKLYKEGQMEMLVQVAREQQANQQ